jgi:hypothetical protein
MLMDFAMPGDRNLIKKEAKKILKHENLIIEIQRMWNVKEKLIPVIKGATGTISKSLRQYLSNVPGQHEIKELQKQPHWALHSYCWKCWRKSTKLLHGRNNITCGTNCKYRTAETLYTL